jgi:hypothetical protein
MLLQPPYVNLILYKLTPNDQNEFALTCKKVAKIANNDPKLTGSRLILSPQCMEVIFYNLELHDQVAFIKTSKILYKKFKKDVRYNKNRTFTEAYEEIDDLFEQRYRFTNASSVICWNRAEKKGLKIYGLKICLKTENKLSDDVGEYELMNNMLEF